MRRSKPGIKNFVCCKVPLARGLVQVANWKALPFDQITDNLDDTVESLLKDISNHITLKILTKQFVISAFQVSQNGLKQDNDRIGQDQRVSWTEVVVLRMSPALGKIKYSFLNGSDVRGDGLPIWTERMLAKLCSSRQPERNRLARAVSGPFGRHLATVYNSNGVYPAQINSHLCSPSMKSETSAKLYCRSSTDASSSQCISDLRQRLLKAAISKQPHILSTVDNQQIKDLILQVVAGDEPSMLNFDQIQAINEWLEQLDDNHTDRKRLHFVSSPSPIDYRHLSI
uniref:ULD domain-containing protein n=1 Tax=Setaria digitata TaxID=48799 RepID=A0A915Q832_9BILA